MQLRINCLLITELEGGDIVALKKDMIVAVLATFCFTATLFMIIPTNSMSTTGTGEYDPWLDTNDDGEIDIYDIVAMCNIYGTKGTPINKTELLLDLLERVEALENQSLPEGFITAPAYDSGWVEMDPGPLWLTHNLNTRELFIYVLGREDDDSKIHQRYYGGAHWYDSVYEQNDAFGLYWYPQTENTFYLYRFGDDFCWRQVRVMLWKIQP